MPQGYDGLPNFYTASSNPITANIGLSLKGCDPIVAENFYLIDTAFGSGGTSVEVNGSVVNSPNFNGTTPSAPVGNVNVIWQVSGSSVSAYVPTSGGTNPMTTFGDMIYEDATPTAARLAGNTTTTKMYLSQTGNGSISAVPAWAQVSPADLSIGALPNGITATTQPNASDASTKVATDAFVQNAIELSMGTLPLNLGGLGPATYSFASLGSGALVNYTASGGVIISVTVWIPFVGSGYKAGDLINVSGGNYDATIAVTAVAGGGYPTSGVVLYGGTGYTSGTSIAAPAVSSIPFTFLLSGALSGNIEFLMSYGTYLTQSNQWIFCNNTTGAYTVTVGVSNSTNTGASGGRTVVIPQGSNNNRSVFIQDDGELNTDLAGVVNYADLSGTPQLPVTIAAVAHNFLTSYTSTTGVFTAAQPAVADLSDTPAANFVLAGPTTGPAATATFRALVAADIPAPVSGTILWSALGNAAGALTLANGNNATTFNQTSAVNWTWANTASAASLFADTVTDLSTPSAWTNTNCTVVTSPAGGPGGTSIKAAPSQNAHITAGVAASTVISFQFYFYNATVALCDFYFGCNSSGLGTGLRIEGRAGQKSGLFASTTFTSGQDGTATTVPTTLAWHTISIIIDSTGTRATWYLDGVVQESNIAITISGAYIGVYGDAGTNGADFANITVSNSASVQSPILNLSGSYWTGSAFATDTWAIQDNTSGPQAVLSFSHSGSATAAVSMPEVITPYITTATTQLLLEQTGDTSGTTQLILQNRSGSNGAIFKNLALDVVDFAFVGSGAVQGNLRYEHRSTATFNTGNTAGEFQFITNNGTTQASIGQIGITLLAGDTLGWVASSHNAADSGISRLGAASLAVGNGTAGDVSGTLTANTVIVANNKGFQWVNGNNEILQTSAFYIRFISQGNSHLGVDPSGYGFAYSMFGFNGTNTLSAIDTGISWLAAGSLAIGTGTAGDFTGALKLTTLTLQGKIGTYNGVATVNQGVAPILAAPARLTSQTAAQSAVSLVASALAGMYRISYVASITTVSDISSVLGGSLGFAVTFTDPQDSVAKTSNPTTPTISAANTTGTTVSGDLYVYAKVGTAITYNFGYTDSHTSTAMAYNIAVYAEYLG